MENKIDILKENGETVACDILLTFDSDETNKSYVVYTDGDNDEEGNLKVYASTYVLDNDGKFANLENLTENKEWKWIEQLLESIRAQYEKMEESN